MNCDIHEFVSFQISTSNSWISRWCYEAMEPSTIWIACFERNWDSVWLPKRNKPRHWNALQSTARFCTILDPLWLLFSMRYAEKLYPWSKVAGRRDLQNYSFPLVKQLKDMARGISPWPRRKPQDLNSVRDLMVSKPSDVPLVSMCTYLQCLRNVMKSDQEKNTSLLEKNMEVASPWQDSVTINFISKMFGWLSLSGSLHSGSSLTRASAQYLFEAWQTQWRRWGLMDAVQMGNDNRFDWTWVSWACKDDRQSTTSCGRAQQIGHSEATTVGIRPENCFTGKCVHFRAVAYYRYVNCASWHSRVFILSGSIVV